MATPAVLARFVRLPAEELDPRHVYDVVPASFAVLHAHAEARAAGALATDAKLPADLVARATTVEARMQRLCEYHFADDPEIAPILDDLRPGTGHKDLAGDLLGYARIYGLRKAIVEADQRHFEPTDKADAEAIGARILALLGESMTPAGRKAADDLARAFTVLAASYDEVAAAGRWLFRKRPEDAARFVSLHTAGRRPRTRKAKDGGGAPGGGEA